MAPDSTIIMDVPGTAPKPSFISSITVRGKQSLEVSHKVMFYVIGKIWQPCQVLEVFEFDLNFSTFTNVSFDHHFLSLIFVVWRE